MLLLSVCVFAVAGIVRAAGPLLSLTAGPHNLGPKGKQVNLSAEPATTERLMSGVATLLGGVWFLGGSA